MAEVLAPFAEQHGDADALSDERGAISWRDLAPRMAMVARRLRRS